MSGDESGPVARALAYASCGWPVFPCREGRKEPDTPHGFKDATTDPERITAWWTAAPDRNVAIATGAPGPDVLDVDVRPGGSGYQAFNRLRRAGLAEGFLAVVATPSGGLHAYYTGTEQGSGRLPAHHLDFKAVGGYVLAPPSQVGGRPYQVITSQDQAPGTRLDWVEVVGLLDPPERRLQAGRQRDGRRDGGRLASWVAGLSEGNRNAGLFWAACRSVEAGRADALDALADAARTAGLAEDDLADHRLGAADRGLRAPLSCPAGPRRNTRPPRRNSGSEQGGGHVKADNHQVVTRAAARRRQPEADAASVREHVLRLRLAGGSYAAIGRAAGLGAMTVHAIANGAVRVTSGTAAAVLAVGSDSLPPARPDAGGTRLRLRALQVMGHGSARVARAVGVPEQAIQQIVRGDARTVSPELRDAVTRVYDAWWDKRAPETTREERAAASAARRRAIRGDWCAGAGLDDDELDIPGYQPACGWRPARGTGIAQDCPAAAGGEEEEVGA